MIITASFAAVYYLLFLSEYLTTPLGRVALLDSREILNLSNGIFHGTLPPEPFYRAPLYPAFLSSFLWLGAPENILLLIAQLVNGACHVLSVIFVFRISFLIWENQYSAFFSSALYALYPVAVYFAGDAFDITFATTLFLAGLWCLAKYIAAQDLNRNLTQRLLIFGASILFGLALLTRPHFFTLLAFVPIVVITSERLSLRTIQTLVVATIGFTIVLGTMGVVNFKHAGEFRILPWQGAYNLWAANKPEANGRYFEQSMAVLSYDENANPTRIESEALYLSETNSIKPINISVANNYWRTKAVRYIVQHPIEWSRLVLKKTLFLTHNQEQYNNKTYSFHKDRSTWLSLNPLGWGVLACFGLVGLVMLPRRFIVLVLATILLYGGGVLLFYSSARFRLPMAPILAILSGGLFVFTLCYQKFSTRKKATVAGLVLLTGSLVFYPFDLVDTSNTHAQDYILLGRASFKLANYTDAKTHFENANKLQPNRLTTRNLLCSNTYNQILSNTNYKISKSDLSTTISHCSNAASISTQAKVFEGYFRWLDGQITDAKGIWESVVLSNDEERYLAYAMLLLADIESHNTKSILRTINLDTLDTFSLFALKRHGYEGASAVLANRLNENQIQQKEIIYNSLFLNNRVIDE